MKHRILPIALAALFLAGAPKASAAPPLINYQGRVAVGTPAVNFEGTGQFKFALVDATGGVTYWSNDGSSVGGSQPVAGVPLTVTKGLYSVLLGDTPLMNPLLGPAIFSQPDLRLRVWFSDNTPTGFQLLSPDQRLAPTAYLADGAVTSGTIAPGAVNSANIAPYAIRTEHFFPGSLDFSILQVRAPGPTPGQVLSFDGGSMVWTAPGGGAFALNGTHAYYNGGNVGIGTASPSWPLDVNGSMHVGSYSANGLPKLIRFGDGDFVSIGENNQDDRMELTASTFVFNNGNVGIGMNTPSHHLAIAGGPAWTSEFWAGAVELTNGAAIGWAANAGGQQFGLGHSTSGGGFFRTASNLGTTGSQPFYDLFITDAGNVGIGTTTAQAKLEVSGNVRINSGSGIALNAADGPIISRGWDPFDPGAPLNRGGHGRWGMFMEPSRLVCGFPEIAGTGFEVAGYFPGGGRIAYLQVVQGGNIGIGTSAPQQRLHVIGNILASGTITGSSDRNVKRDFTPVNSSDVLDKVAALPISTWSYIADDGVRHLGPMAQDFYSAFNVGMDEKHISMVDADGVALAAIQGLNQKVEQKDAEIRNLRGRLEKLEQFLGRELDAADRKQP